MSDERRPAVPGFEWAQSMLDAPLRAHAEMTAEMTAETLRKLNAPVVEALARQRQLAESLAQAAQQIGEVARLVEQLARQHAELADHMRAGLDPYLRYIEWLRDAGTGTGTGTGRIDAS